MRIRFSQNQRAWLAGMILSSVLWIFLFLFADVYFSTNDDQFLLRTFSGAAPGGAPAFHVFLGSLFVYPLKWANSLFPKVAWFSILEIALMWLSTATIVKSIIRCLERSARGNAFEKGVASSLCFTLLFLFYLCARPTFTTMAASLGAAAVAQLLSVDFEKATRRQLLFSVGFSFFLLILCFHLRGESVLPLSAFFALALLYLMLNTQKSAPKSTLGSKRFVLLFLALVLTAGMTYVGRQWEIEGNGKRDLIEWQATCSNVIDFLKVEDISPETRQAVGWSDAQVALLNNWYTMEEVLSTEAFVYVHEHENLPERRYSPGAAIYDFRTLSPLIALSLVLLFIIGLACLVGLAIRRKGLWTFLALMCAAGGCLIMLAYLAWQGRLPYRAVMVPVLPAAAFVFCLIPDCLPDKRWFQSAFFALLIACTAVYLLPTARSVKHRESPWDYNTHAAMDEIALENPDLLFIYSNELVNDLRMFPDFSNGVPTNLMFWGGWQRGSPEYNARMEAYGLDGDHFQPEDWLNPALRYLTLEDEPHPLLVQHLREKLGENLRWERTPMDVALDAYRFYLE